MLSNSNQTLVIKIVLLSWIFLGLFFSQKKWADLVWLGQMSNSLKQFDQTGKNRIIQGPIYIAYQKLNQTPLNTKILYLIPDIGHLARAVYYLYPRSIDVASSPAHALAKLQLHQYDYVLLYVVSDDDPSYSPLAKFQEYWHFEDFPPLISMINHTKTLSSETEILTLLSENNGVLLYQMDNTIEETDP